MALRREEGGFGRLKNTSFECRAEWQDQIGGDLTRLLSAFGRLESGGREPKMPYKVLGARRWVFARRWRDMHEVDEAKAVHKVIISSVRSMIRKIDDVEGRGEEQA